MDSDELASRIAELKAIEEIKQLKARYFYCLDHKDWDGWRNTVFCADATLDVQEARAEPYVGIDAIIEMIDPMLIEMVTVHHGHMPIIEIITPTTATGIWAMEDVLFWPKQRRADGVEGRVQGYGHYRETYVRETAGWRIKTLRLTRLLHPTKLS